MPQMRVVFAPCHYCAFMCIHHIVGTVGHVGLADVLLHVVQSLDGEEVVPSRVLEKYGSDTPDK